MIEQEIEVVARALCRSFPLNCNCTACPHVGRCVGTWPLHKNLIKDAKAAITAIDEFRNKAPIVQ